MDVKNIVTSSRVKKSKSNSNQSAAQHLQRPIPTVNNLPNYAVVPDKPIVNKSKQKQKPASGSKVITKPTGKSKGKPASKKKDSGTKKRTSHNQSHSDDESLAEHTATTLVDGSLTTSTLSSKKKTKVVATVTGQPVLSPSSNLFSIDDVGKLTQRETDFNQSLVTSLISTVQEELRGQRDHSNKILDTHQNVANIMSQQQGKLIN